ncbi:MAG TPA: YihY/virulence factor BrkB family protein [Phycisphaerae bacterium]|nr:YihY/virulence factor BrkB family protein [Phycisphaerae bacterium]HOJ74959.1 YihY/virulence factor BrkB family protein [Phycisphaerae bacterium]HOM51520.1 YihY/virulence factor BrkB family protein [Phycisphaerae bacterium]HON66707.1 YihY/virulence factor BrkB family protein [Phycisphaerae bacterium]HOQ87690.1 YihY/virulence factor BrkB family protein [Phycisphaerae bacterium]
MENQAEQRNQILWRAVKKGLNQLFTDGAMKSVAALSFYLALSLAPLVLVAIALSNLVLTEPQASQNVVARAERFMGLKGAQIITGIIEQAEEAGAGTASLIAGLLVGLFGATGAFIHLQEGLDSIWNVHPGKLGWPDKIRDRLVSVGIVLVIGSVMLASLLLTALATAVNLRLQTRIPGIAWVWQGLDFLGSLAVMTVLFACVYKFLPHIQISWRQVWMGAFVTALLFDFGKTATGWYLGWTGLGTSSQAAGVIVVMLLWEYYSSLVILFGAELTHAYTKLSGKQVQPTAATSLTGAAPPRVP